MSPPHWGLILLKKNWRLEGLGRMKCPSKSAFREAGCWIKGPVHLHVVICILTSPIKCLHQFMPLPAEESLLRRHGHTEASAAFQPALQRLHPLLSPGERLPARQLCSSSLRCECFRCFFPSLSGLHPLACCGKKGHLKLGSVCRAYGLVKTHCLPPSSGEDSTFSTP